MNESTESRGLVSDSLSRKGRRASPDEGGRAGVGRTAGGGPDSSPGAVLRRFDGDAARKGGGPSFDGSDEDNSDAKGKAAGAPFGSSSKQSFNRLNESGQRRKRSVVFGTPEGSSAESKAREATTVGSTRDSPGTASGQSSGTLGRQASRHSFDEIDEITDEGRRRAVVGAKRDSPGSALGPSFDTLGRQASQHSFDEIDEGRRATVVGSETHEHWLRETIASEGSVFSGQLWSPLFSQFSLTFLFCTT